MSNKDLEQLEIKCMNCSNIIKPNIVKKKNPNKNKYYTYAPEENFWICSHHNYFCVCCSGYPLGFRFNYNYKCDICKHIHPTTNYKAYTCNHNNCSKIIRLYKFCTCCFMNLETEYKTFEEKLQNIVCDLHSEKRAEFMLNSMRDSDQCKLSKKIYCISHLVNCLLCEDHVHLDLTVKNDEINEVCFSCYLKVRKIQKYVLPIIYKPCSDYIQKVAKKWDTYNKDKLNL